MMRNENENIAEWIKDYKQAWIHQKFHKHIAKWQCIWKNWLSDFHRTTDHIVSKLHTPLTPNESIEQKC